MYLKPSKSVCLTRGTIFSIWKCLGVRFKVLLKSCLHHCSNLLLAVYWSLPVESLCWQFHEFYLCWELSNWHSYIFVKSLARQFLYLYPYWDLLRVSIFKSCQRSLWILNVHPLKSYYRSRHCAFQSGNQLRRAWNNKSPFEQVGYQCSPTGIVFLLMFLQLAVQ